MNHDDDERRTGGCSTIGRDNVNSISHVHHSYSSFTSASPWSRWIFNGGRSSSDNSENSPHLSIPDPLHSNDKLYSVLSNCSSPTDSTGQQSVVAIDSPVSLFHSSWTYENIPSSITAAPAVPDILEASLAGYPPQTSAVVGFLQSVIEVTDQPSCLGNCAGWNMASNTNRNETGSGGSPLDTNDESKQDTPFGFVDRARMVSFKRKKIAPISSNGENSPETVHHTAGCSQCTCFLDPVAPSCSLIQTGPSKMHDYENTENMVNTGFAFPGETTDIMLAMDSPELVKNNGNDFDDLPKVYLANENTAGRRNKLNLTIDTGAYSQPAPIPPNENRNGYFYDPICDFLMSSPVMRKLRELGFQYPTFPSEECTKQDKRLRVLYFLIALLLLIVVGLVIWNFLAPKVIDSQPATRLFAPDSSGSPDTTQSTWTNPISSTLIISSPHNSTEHPPMQESVDQAPVHQFESVGNQTDHSSSTTYQTSTGTAPIRENATTVFPTPARVNFEPEQFSVQNLSTSTVGYTTRSSKTSIGVNVTLAPTSSVTSLFPISYPPNFKCPEDQFKCRSGVSRMPCLYQWERCDGIADCSDGSDEEFCDTIKCFGNFQCGDKSCVALAKVCNGIFDCPDATDEQHCDKFKCQSYEYRCPSGYCIPKEWVCDGEADCPRHFDEYNCSSACSSSQFLCPEGWCIPSAWRCNGVQDCAGGQDEENCACTKPDQLKCSSGGGKCIDKEKICDGIPDCPDFSDEWNCVMIRNDVLLLRDQNGDQLLPVCSQEWTAQDSDLACRQMGFEKSEHFWEMPLGPANSSQLFVKSALTQTFSSGSVDRVQFLVKKKPGNSCATHKSIGIMCQNFECGHWTGSQIDLNENRIRRMVGGETSQEHEWPSLAVLYHPQKKWACTASVIAPFWLVTSALCVRRTDISPIDWKVIAGNADPSETDPQRQITRSILRFVQHPSYKLSLTLLADYDVMLVQLSNASPLASNQDMSRTSFSPDIPLVSAICMPDGPTQPGTRCVTAGWGYTTPGGYFINKLLKHLPVGIWPREVCNSTAHYPGLLSERSICAANDRDDWGPCFNDEGAPLMCHNVGSPDRWYLAGVLTSQSCGSTVKHPAVFADVHSMQNWINGVIGRPVGV